MAPNQDKSNIQKKILKTKPEEILDKKKQKKKELVPYLNDDIMWHILNRVPAISLVENCMFLSKQWYNMICNQSFLKAHSIGSKPGMIYVETLKEKGEDVKLMKFVEVEGMKITDVHLLHIFKNDVEYFSCCGGLFIMRDYSCSETYVINPITKESIPLPPRQTETSLWREIPPRQIATSLWWELVFDQACMDCRIVDLSYFYPKQEYVLTLFGLDGSCTRIKAPEWLGGFVLINGVLYCEREVNKSICCLDLSTETFSHINWPIINAYDPMYYNSKILDAGGSLGFVAFQHVKISIWILRQQKWEEIYCIDREEKSSVKHVFGCPGNEDLFLFAMFDNTLKAYDVKNKQWTTMKHSDKTACYGIHVSSILPLTSKRVSQW